MKFIITVIFIVIFFYALVRYLEKTSVFYPSRTIEITPDRLNLPYEDITLTTDDSVQINGWLVKSPQAKSTLLFLHGNAGNISDRLMKMKLFYTLGVNIFIIDYRGYGRSQGIPSEKGVYRDGLAAFDYLKSREDLAHLPIVIYGGSLGGAVAVEVATHRKVDGLIIDSAFTSAPAMGRLLYPFVPTIFMSIKFDSQMKVKSLTIPKLFLHSVEDEVVPVSLGRQLFEAAAQPKEFVELTGGHINAHVECRELFLESIGRFLRKRGWL